LTEGEGASIPVITPSTLSYEKRKVMIKMLSYGRKDQVDEIVKSVQAQRNNSVRRCSWASDWEEQLEEEHWYEEEEKQEMIEQERLDFEIKHCLGIMRMFFLMGKKYVIA
jgi:hypothetical protein